ncbi:hypothetical protein IGB42_03628 [Andreprevotia sp. IGB-42]|uniref:YybH family protein n=1 Tax=Andreprevotia sp. IGB-42 TaxID=2497473 RepID=UPI00135703C3|nr:SgcJ/EcaC family oxidoreductase [Andreprevotia sp. IGB-42]KAF0811818.1 hypothetical protein IGB42_03628 [Andreprevotia sp. IGB-42]
MQDEQAIRDLLADWREATQHGDAAQLQALCTDDVVFLQPGQPPMHGAAAFAAVFRSVIGEYGIDYTQTVEEIRMQGDYAYCWTGLVVTITPRNGGDVRQRAGNTLSVLRRENGRWLLCRDANMLVTVPLV